MSQFASIKPANSDEQIVQGKKIMSLQESPREGARNIFTAGNLMEDNLQIPASNNIFDEKDVQQIQLNSQ